MGSRFVAKSIVVISLALVASSCQHSESAGDASTTSTPDAVTTTVSAGFDDHTLSEIGSLEVFDEFARVEGVQTVLKFAIPDLSEPGVVWMDSTFYEYHDEWYWFRLLNGESVPGLATEPVEIGVEFETIDEAYDWAHDNRDALPLHLEFTADGRLYSERYYELALRDDAKTYGLGSLIRYSTEDGDRWVVQLEYSEPTTIESIGQFFDRLAETLPSEIGNNLDWVPRSPAQAETAVAMEGSGGPNASRVVHYTELVPLGDVTVYSPGITAGRLRLINNAEDLNLARSTDILIMEDVPDWLPPATAILTGQPQTPLAHVNLLARNRGIPNVSISGLLDNRAIVAAARLRVHAVVRATASGDVEITLIPRQQFVAWNSLRQAAPIAVPAVDLNNMPTVVSLTELAATIESEADLAELRPIIGGKSAGFLTLIAANGVTAPDTPLGVTVAPYFRHLATLETELDAMLADGDFIHDSRIRFLLLEGGEEYAETYSSEKDAELASNFVDTLDDGPIRSILDADGFMNLFRDVDMADDDLAEITEALESTFAPLSDLQGLRFRSSSSVEDIEGFTGAGLYDSNTGFLQPERQINEKDHKKTVERTIKKTWASYWSFEAFEERRLENVDHRSGGMAVVVHPRFDDALEVDNGVATLTLLPDGDDDRVILVINVQAGDVSVANPDADSDVLPEQIEVRVSDAGVVSIERLGSSTLVDTGEAVMDDDSVIELVGQLEAVASLWRDRVNADLDAAQQVDIATLDFEFKHMAQGWPALASGDIRPERLVVKQARSLDPGLRGISAEVLALGIPRDVLARAAVVQTVTCEGGAAGIEVTMSGSVHDGLFDPVLRFSDAPDELDDEGCERATLLSTPEQMLVELLASGEGLQVG